MKHPKTLPVFTIAQYKRMHRLLATKVAMMMGRKFEEDDWAEVYCIAKQIPNTGWSNLKIDIMHQGLGVEHKQLKVRSNRSVVTYCGERRMHPSLTRSIRVPDTTVNPNKAMRDILKQYGQLLADRTARVRETSHDSKVDMRTGLLLWQNSLEEFLYFEEEMLIPDPDDYYAEWHESTSKSSRKDSVNLWIYEKTTGVKRYSVTTSAGVKIQGYFDIPPPNDENLYIFRVQGEAVSDEKIRIWLTPSTKRELENIVGDLNQIDLSQIITQLASSGLDVSPSPSTGYDLAMPIIISETAYGILRENFEGVSDEHTIRLLIQYLRERIS